MSTALDELPARMAWVSDLVDGHVSGRWEDQPEEVRRAYRRAVEGEDDVHGSANVAAAVAYLRVATMQQIHGDQTVFCPHPPETGHGWPRHMKWTPSPTAAGNLGAALLLIKAELDRLEENW